MKNWDLSKLYSSFEDDDFLKDIEKLKKCLEDLKIFISKIENIKINEVEIYLNKTIELRTIFSKLYSFASLSFTVNTADANAMKYNSILEMLINSSTEIEVKFQKLLSKMPNFNELLEYNDFTKEHAFYLKEVYESSKYLLSEEEEILYSRLKASSSSAFETLQGKVSSKLMIPYKEGKKPLSFIRSLAYDKDVNIRKEAYEAELASYENIEDATEMALNSIKNEAIIIAEKRGYDSVLDMTLKNSRMDKKTLDTMLVAMKESLPYFRKFFRKKAEVLNDSNGLKFYNLFAPIDDSDLEFSYEESRDFIIKQFSSFSNKLGEFAKRAFDENWIDPFPKEGKLGGAFCAGIHAIGESRILSNFNNSFNDLITLAHELGHGYHGDVLMDSSILNSEYPMPLAETASIFCETIVFNAAFNQAGQKDKISILENDLTGSAQVIVDILSRYIFETKVIEKRKESVLSVDELKELMIEAQKESYGDGLDNDFLHPYMWACKPHYYSVDYNFYNFPYAFGLLFAKGLYAKYLEDKEAFLKIYDKLLVSTGNNNIYDCVKSVGIDLHDIEFWRSSLKVITDDIEKFISYKF